MFRNSLKRFSQQILSNNIGSANSEISLVKKIGNDFFSLNYSKNMRHTVYKEVQEQDYTFSYRRKSAYDYLSDFINVVMPKVENFVEARLLEKFKSKLEPAEKQLVEDAYNIRKYKANLKRNIQESEPIEEKANLKTIDLAIYYKTVMNFEGEGFAEHDYSSIGKYVVFPEEKRNEYFPFGCYGNYMKNEFSLTNQIAIMCRDEGLKLANTFSYIKTAEERAALLNYEAIYAGKFDFKNLVNKFEVFSTFYQEFALTLLSIISESKNSEYSYMITNPDIFDSLLTIFTKSLRKNHINIFLATPTTRHAIFKSVLDAVHEKLATKFKFSSQDNVNKDLKISEKDYYPISFFDEIINAFKVFKFELDYSDIKAYCEVKGYKLCDEIANRKSVQFTLHLTDYYENCKMQWRPKDHREILSTFKGFNTGALLFGEGGNGKSMTLAYLHAWAKESGWVVFGINDPRKFTHASYDLERHPSGIFVQPELAREFLLDFKIVNYNLIKNAKIEGNTGEAGNSYVYGRYDFAGNCVDDPDANPILWDERRQVYTDSWKAHNTIPEDQINLKDYPDHTQTLKEKEHLPNPKTVLEIVEYGISNERMACNAIAEVISYFIHSNKHKTIFIIDGYNEWFKPSMYDSYKYANYKGYETKIPPYDLAMCRMFMRFNGHMIKQGVKVVASTCHRFGKHEFKPEMINYPQNYAIDVENLKLDDLRNALGYYMLFGFSDNVYTEQEIQDLFMVSQGNWKQMQDDMNSIRLLPNYSAFLFRKIRDKEIKRAKNI